MRNVIPLLVSGAMATANLSAQYFINHRITLNESADPGNYTVFNDHLYFTARNDSMNSVVYYTDGYPGGSVLLADAQMTPIRSTRILGVFHNRLYLYGNNGPGGSEVWYTDGTPAGTARLKDINTQPFPGGSSSTVEAAVVNGRLVFNADDGINGNELWVTDGTEAGTLLLKNIHPSGAANPLFFFLFNNRLFFKADDGTNGAELWVTDGTAGGTELFLDINPSGNGIPSFFHPTIFDGKMWFSANDGVHGEELWYSDGTPGGTHMLLDLHPTGTGVNLRTGRMAVVNDAFYFVGNDGVYGSEVWKTDGTPEGTVLVKDIVGGSLSGFPNDLFSFDNRLFFSSRLWAGTVEPYYLWASDGTGAGTVQMAVSSYLRNPFSFVEFNGLMYFTAENDTVGRGLWRSDGTPAGTVHVTPPFYTGTYGMGTLTEWMAYKNNLFFDAYYENGRSNLWSYGDTIVASVNDWKVPGLSFTVFPNPAQSQLTVSCNLPEPTPLILEMLDVTGKRLAVQSLSAVSGNYRETLQIPGECSNGLYIIRLSASTGTYHSKFVLLR